MAYRATAKTRKHKEDIHQKIITAARTTVADGGFSAVHMSAIAASAGLATGTLYRHFPSKADLLAEVFRRVTQHEVQVVADIAGSNGPAQDRLADALWTFASRALRAPKLAYALIFEPVDTLVDSERLIFRRSYAMVFNDIIKDGIIRGEFPDQNTTVAANCIVGAIAEALVGPLSSKIPNSADDRDADIRSIVTFCLNAVTGHPKEPNA